MKKRKFSIFLYNRATYFRCAGIIKEINEDENLSIDIVLSGALLENEHRRTVDYIYKEHSNTNIFTCPIRKHTDNNRMTSLMAGDICHMVSDFLTGKEYDGVLIVADRFEMLPTAMVAAYMNYRIIHIQGGEISGNIDEKIRHSITKLADYHLVATECAQKYVTAMGEESSRVFFVGCPTIDMINSWNLHREINYKNKYIVCLYHPDANDVEKQLENLKAIFKPILEFCIKNNAKARWYWPNPDPNRTQIIDFLEEELSLYPDYLTKEYNKGPKEFLEEIVESLFLIGNSSTGIREASYLGIPVINIGNRQNCREKSWNVYDSDYSEQSVNNAMNYQLLNPSYKKSYLYGEGMASRAIVKILKDVELTIKPSLTYPTQLNYKEDHFGKTRFENHNTRTV